jgi:hypothetical protein
MVMASNIIDVIKDHLGDNFADAAAGVTGLGAEPTRRTVGAAIPAVLAGILGATQTPAGSSAFASALRTQDPNLLSNLSSMLTGGNRQSLINSGISILTSLLGEGKLSGLVNALSSFGGINQGAGKSLLGLLAPVVIGALGQQQRAGNLSVDGLAGMLEGQRGNIAAALPSNLSTSLQSTGLLDGLGDATRAVTGGVAAAGRTAASGAAAAAAAAQSARRGSNWMMYAVGLGVLALVIWGVSRYVGTAPVEQAAQQASDTATQVAATAESMMVGDVDVGKEFTTFSEGLTQAMKDVKDEATAKAALPKLTELTTKLDTLTPLVAKLPEAAKTALAETVKTTIAGLQAEVDRVSAISGVSDAIKPALDTLKGKLDALVA